MGVKEKLGNLYYKYKIQPAIDKNGIEWVRQRLYDNLNPVGYWEPVKRVNSALDGNMYSETPEQQLETGRKRDDIFAEYLSIPQSQRHNVSEYIVQNSDYVPTKQTNQNSIYKKIPLTDEDRSKLVHDAFNETFDLHRDNSHGFYKRVEKGPLQIGESKVSSALSTLLGPHTVSRGFDNNGDYISYYDYWDIAPISGKGNGDETKGIGKPVEFYDRIYLDDYYDIPEEARGNPFIAPSVVIANEKHEKGGILKAQDGTGNNFWSKLWTAVKEGGMAARDAKIGAVGAQQVRDLYSEGKNQEAQDLAKQYTKANTTGIALGGGAASTGLLGDLIVTGATTAADTFIDGDVDNFGKNLSLNAAFDLVGHGAGKLLRKIYPKISQEATSKIEALLKRFPEGVKSVNSVSKELKDRLIKEGVDPSILTQDNLKKMVYLRSKDLLESNVPDKFAARTNSKISNTYNLYYNTDGQTRNVGYVVATPENGVGKIKMIENVTEHTPDKVKGVSELGYNAVIKDIGASKNGTVLMQPNKTTRVLEKYPDKVIVSNDGEWFNGSKYIEGNPVFQLNSPTFDVPVKYLDDFSTEGIDYSGKFLFDFTKDALHKAGGKL